MDDNILKSSIPVFDLRYYNLERFKELKNKNILFVSRVKRNAVYKIKGKINWHEIIEFKNGLKLRIVRININNEKYTYITNILKLPDKYIAYAYNLRWNMEEFFKTMNS
jgi:IS4 transposase